MFRSLLQWPPQPSTVVGVGVLAGLAAYLVTGDAFWAIAAGGVVKILVPDNSAAGGEVTDLIKTLARALGRPIATIALCVAIGAALTACATNGGGSAGQKVAAGVQGVAAACRALQPAVNATPAAMVNADDAARAKAVNIVSYIDAACGSQQAIAAVVAADPSGGADTVTWATALGAGLVAALPAVATAIH